MNYIVAVTGGIAAYKSCELVRVLKAQGHAVRVIMTKAAQSFVSAMTFQALSGQPVHTELFDLEQEQAMGHIELARWADRIVIAPASAHCIAKLAQGQADDLLTTVCLATEARRYVVPAMNRVMWQDPAVQQNRQKLISYHYRILGPAYGEQACGEVGLGRMLSVEEILQQLEQPKIQKKVVITAGPTSEAIDPVRVISNRSSGKMGYALATALIQQGCEVTLVSGPTRLPRPNGVAFISVESAEEMYAACQQAVQDADMFIAAAAVCDYKPEHQVAHKIKKQEDGMALRFVKTIDVLKTISHEHPHLFSVGFALESQHVLDYARHKLIDKKLDMVVANRVDESLGQDSAKVTVITAEDTIELGPATKSVLAEKLIRFILKQEQREKNNETVDTA